MKGAAVKSGVYGAEMRRRAYKVLFFTAVFLAGCYVISTFQRFNNLEQFSGNKTSSRRRINNNTLK